MLCFSSSRRETNGGLVTGVHTCALPIFEHHYGHVARWRRVRACGARVVLLGAEVGWVPCTGAGTRRAELLPAAAAAAGRDEERLCADAVEGQARRLEQRLGRSGVHAGAGVARRRRGTWRR